MTREAATFAVIKVAAPCSTMLAPSQDLPLMPPPSTPTPEPSPRPPAPAPPSLPCAASCGCACGRRPAGGGRGKAQEFRRVPARYSGSGPRRLRFKGRVHQGLLYMAGVCLRIPPPSPIRSPVDSCPCACWARQWASDGTTGRCKVMLAVECCFSFLFRYRGWQMHIQHAERQSQKNLLAAAVYD